MKVIVSHSRVGIVSAPASGPGYVDQLGLQHPSSAGGPDLCIILVHIATRGRPVVCGALQDLLPSSCESPARLGSLETKPLRSHRW